MTVWARRTLRAGQGRLEAGAPVGPWLSGRFPEALWWSATLVTTINISADPVTVEGRIIAYLLRLLGLAVFGYVAGSIASYLVGGEEEPGPEEPEGAVKTETLEDIRRQLEEISARLERLEERE